jgi:hypothetical protein
MKRTALLIAAGVMLLTGLAAAGPAHRAAPAHGAALRAARPSPMDWWCAACMPQ